MDVRIILKTGKKFLKITSVSEHVLSGYSVSTILSFRSIENEHDVYRGNKCMKKFYEPLREDAMKIVICKKKKKNEVINKIVPGIIWKSKNLLYL